MTVIMRDPDNSEIEQSDTSLNISMLTFRCDCMAAMQREDRRREPGRSVYSYQCGKCGSGVEVLVPQA